MYKKLAILLILFTLILMGCSKQVEQTEDNTYDEYLILGMTETQYINAIKNDIQTIYAPRVKMSESNLKKILVKHMTEECAVDFATPNEESNVEPKDITLTWERINFAYGIHQPDGISRVIAQFRVDTKARLWDITLELKLNADDMIYDYDVY